MTQRLQMHWCAALAVLLLPQEPSIEVVLRGKAAGGSIEFGAPFALEVVRRWPRDAVAEPWNDAALTPLIVQQLSISREDVSDQIVETRRFRAWAFRRGAVTMQPQFGLVLPDGTKSPRVTAKLCTLLVDSTLPGADAGAAEKPPAPPLQITPVRRELLDILILAAAAGAVAFLLIAGIRWLRRRAVPKVGPRAELLARIEVLARAAADTRVAQRAEAVAATRILRAAEQLATERDRESADQSAQTRESVNETLAVVKFAGAILSPADRQAWITDLHQVVMSVPSSATSGRSSESEAGPA